MSKNRSVITNFTEGPLTKRLFLFALPMMAGNVLQALYTLVDMAIVGQFCGSSGLSAVSTSGQILMLLYGLGMCLGTGGQILVAQQVGGGSRKNVSVTIGTSFTLTTIVSVVLAVACMVGRGWLLDLMNIPPEAKSEAYAYLFWCAIGVPFNSIYSSLSSVLRGLGDSKHPTWFMGVSCGANIVLDYLLVAVFGMDAMGAAIATSGAQLLACVACIGFICIHHEDLGIELKLNTLKMDRNTAVTIVKLATPLAVQNISINISMMCINSWINIYGVTASAVGGVGTKLYSLAGIVSGAMNTGTATFTGQNIAAGKTERVRQTMHSALLFAMLYWLFCLCLCLFFPKAVFSLFTSDTAVLEMAPDYMHIMILMYLGSALMAPCNGLLNGIGDVRLSVVIGLTDGVIARISLCLIFARVLGFGLYGYWWGAALASYVSVIWGWCYYFKGSWKTRKLLVTKEEPSLEEN